MLKYACTRVGPMVRNLASSFVPRRHVSGPGYSFLLDSGTRGSRRRRVFPRIIAAVVLHIVVIIVDVVVMSGAGEAALSRDARELPVDR